MQQVRLVELLEKIRQAEVAVYGDFCLDVYWEMLPEGSEISVETGNQAAAVRRHYYSPGGAGNVTANLAALQPAVVIALGAIGGDIYGSMLVQLLEEKGIDTRHLVVQNSQFDTYAFVKQYIDQEEISRTDFGTKNKRTAETDQKILESMEYALKHCDALIFNQQVPDSISRPEFITEVQELFESYPDKVVLVDTRHVRELFRGVYYKTNDVEIRKWVDPGSNQPEEEIRSLAEKLSEQIQKPVFLTRGENGILVIDPQSCSEVPGLQIDGPIDAVGGGDTVISALALCLATGIDPVEAAEFANLAAGVTIQKLRTTGTANGNEILALNEYVLQQHKH